jgi:tetratricopeptide (TPR) repeat protein
MGLTSLLSAESDRQPVIVILEDAHWLDEDTKTFLPQLSQTLTAGKSHPLAFVATVRPVETEPVLGNELRYEVIDLGQLNEHELAGLAEEQLGAPVSTDLLNRLADRAEGNPFFAEQILHYLQEEDLLSRTNGTWDLASARGESPLPADVRAVLVARLDRLAPAVKEVVQTASILGREFEVRLLAGMLHGEHATPEMMNRAEQADVWSSISDVRYLFKHGLLREAAYRMQVRARRKSLHKTAFEVLEYIHADDLSAHYGELGYHSEQAEVPDKARTYLRLAGDAASEAYSNNQAVDYYRRALVLTSDKTEQVQIMLKQGEVLQIVGQWGEAGQLYDQALALSEELNDQQLRAWCQAAMGELLRKQGQFDEAAGYLDVARITFEEVGNQEGVGQLLHYSGTLAVQRGDIESARTRYQESLAIRRELDDQKHAAALLNNLGIIARRQGEYDAAKALYEESLEFARQAGEKWSIGIFTNNLGNLALEQGDYLEARLQLEEAVNLLREVGDKYQLGNALNNLGNAARAQGDYALAFNMYEESLAINRALGDRGAIAYLLEDIGCLAVLEDRPERALRLCGAAEALRQAIDSLLPPTDLEALDQRLEPARQALGEKATAEALAGGRTMSMERAIELALLKSKEWASQE